MKRRHLLGILSTGITGGCLGTTGNGSASTASPTAAPTLQPASIDPAALPHTDVITYIPYETPTDIPVSTELTILPRENSQSVEFTVSIADDGKRMDLSPHVWRLYRIDSDEPSGYLQGSQALVGASISPGESMTWRFQFETVATPPTNTYFPGDAEDETDAVVVVRDTPIVPGTYLFAVHGTSYGEKEYSCAGAFKFG